MGSQRLTVDVILPIYKARGWVHEAIGSVLAQTYPDWHLTVVDDASPDDSWQAVDAVVRRHPTRISLLRLEERRGPAGARTEGIRKGGGDLVAFLDQDDRWCPDKLERQVQRLTREPPVEAVHTNVVHMDSRGQVIGGLADRENALRSGISFDTLGPEDLLRCLFVTPCIRLTSALMLRSAWEDTGGFDTTLFGGEDWEFWLRFAARGCRVGHLAEPLVLRRIHPDNTTSRYRQTRMENLLKVVDALAGRYPALAPLAPRRKANILSRFLLRELSAGRNREARGWARRFVRAVPGDYRGYIFWFLSYVGPTQRLLRAYLRRRGGFPDLWRSAEGPH